MIGIDIGSEFNAVCLMDKEGDVIGKYPRIYNSRKGFDYFHTIVEQAKRKHGCTDVIIGMEPTGHYWRKIGFFALDRGYQVRFVRTTALKAQRELDESSPAKSDIRDDAAAEAAAGTNRLPVAQQRPQLFLRKSIDAARRSDTTAGAGRLHLREKFRLHQPILQKQTGCNKVAHIISFGRTDPTRSLFLVPDLHRLA